MLISVKNIHFIGIGGIGMSGIAELLHNQKFNITGSDLTQSTNVDRLQKLNIEISIGHKAENINGSDIVVYSDAIPKDNCELIEAKKQNIVCYSRAKMISQLAKLKTSTVAISGTHGKTTTTSMIGSILKDSELDPTIIVGGVVKSINTNSVLGEGDIFVVEADEYNRNFLELNPTIALINNIDLEHVDCYKDIDDLKRAFLEFTSPIPFYGAVSICKDSENAASLIESIDKPIFTYGIKSKDVDFRAEDIVQENGKTTFNLVKKNKKYPMAINLPGQYNVLNALGAISIATIMNIPIDKITTSLNSFDGVKRRFDIKTQSEELTIIDDYGHHPVEVESVIKAIKDNWDRRLVVAFQPHLYSRTAQFFKEFAQSLLLADSVLVTEIFASRESMNESINSEKIVEEMKNLGHESVSDTTLENLINDIESNYKKGDIILMIGAGNIWRYCDLLKDRLI
ncbi:MAG TPA: UDP-N-acetylmuramate--L-alanine ligase [Candidatus Marinimicrobia bacterium]|jgi:UDP-N-acetylmuramate--alanine ligase|nr:UDP-N-acetylmuramate--L-alanine ligase [Candidatus Neomarinimicrobiota bacterium]